MIFTKNQRFKELDPYVDKMLNWIGENGKKILTPLKEDVFMSYQNKYDKSIHESTWNKIGNFFSDLWSQTGGNIVKREVKDFSAPGGFGYARDNFYNISRAIKDDSSILDGAGLSDDQVDHLKKDYMDINYSKIERNYERNIFMQQLLSGQNILIGCVLLFCVLFVAGLTIFGVNKYKSRKNKNERMGVNENVEYSRVSNEMTGVNIALQDYKGKKVIK